jgi:hypothetical protein
VQNSHQRPRPGEEPVLPESSSLERRRSRGREQCRSLSLQVPSESLENFTNRVDILELIEISTGKGEFKRPAEWL